MSTARHLKGDEYAVDVTIDSEYYQEWYEYKLLQAFKEKMPRLESRGAILKDSASPHTGKSTEENLSRVGKRGRVAYSAHEVTSAVVGPQSQ